MGQKKLIRFNEIKGFENVFEYPTDMQGRWNGYFGNDNDIILELACGKGEYTIGLARLSPSQNFIGIDIKGNRIWAGAKIGLKDKLQNAAFIRSHIDKIENYFLPNEVSEIWITFPDPQLRSSRAKKRLTHPHFLRFYQKILKADGCIHLKTDSPALYFFTKQIIQIYNLELLVADEDVYKHGNPGPKLSIQTHYEKLDIAGSNKIFYLNFKLPLEVLPDKSEELSNLIMMERQSEAVLR